MPFLSRGPSGPTQRHSQTQLEAWRQLDRGGRLPGEDSRHLPRGNKIPVKSDDVRGKQFSPPPSTSPAMTRSRLPCSSMPPASGWPRWSRWTGHQDHWLAAPFSPIGRLNEIFNQPSEGRPHDTAEVDAFQEAVRDTFLGVSRSPLTWRAPPASSSPLPAAYDLATTRSG